MTTMFDTHQAEEVHQFRGTQRDDEVLDVSTGYLSQHFAVVRRALRPASDKEVLVGIVHEIREVFNVCKRWRDKMSKGVLIYERKTEFLFWTEGEVEGK